MGETVLLYLFMVAVLSISYFCLPLRRHDSSRATTRQQVREPRRVPGLTQLWPTTETGQSYAVDIVAIHGLDTRSPGTWEAYKNGRDDTDGVVNWLKDENMLHQDFPQARISTYDWFSSSLGDVVEDDLSGHAIALLEALQNRPFPGRCLIVIASSFGGLLLAKAVVLASSRDKYQEIFEEMTKMIFLGTPFKQSEAVDTARMRIRVAKAMGGEVSDKLLRYLTKNNDQLNELVADFENVLKKYDDQNRYGIRCYFELRKSQIYKILLPQFILKLLRYRGLVLVPKYSASLAGHDLYSLNAPHGLLNKCFGREDKNYEQICTGLRRLVSQAEEDDLPNKLKQYYCRNDDERLRVERLSGATLPMSECYINLGIVDRSRGSGREAIQTSFGQSRFDDRPSQFSLAARLNIESLSTDNWIELQKLFDAQETPDGSTKSPNRILIWGGAGIGKTTLCKKIVHEFIHRGLWSGRFNLLFWIPLREFKLDRWKSANLETFLAQKFFQQSTVSSSLSKQLRRLIERHEPSTLFLLDGLDEVSYMLDKEELHDHPLSWLLRCPNVIVTSRPHAVKQLINVVDLELETVGFLPEQVNEYLQQVEGRDNDQSLSTTVKEIRSFIDSRPLVQDLVRIPIMLDAVCYSWRISGASIDAPDKFLNMATLYSRVVHKLWEGYLNRQENKNLRDIQDAVSPKEVEDENDYLGQLAFSGLYHEVIEFNMQYLREITTKRKEFHNSHFTNFPFLRSSDNLAEFTQQTRHFLHLTFQEYFAAHYFVHHWIYKTDVVIIGSDSGHSLNNRGTISPRSFLQAEKYNDRYNIFWRFVVGLLQQAGEEHIEEFFALLGEEPRDLLGPRHQRIVMERLNEVDTTRYLHRTKACLASDYEAWMLCEYRIVGSTRSIWLRECPKDALKNLLQYSGQIAVDFASTLAKQTDISPDLSLAVIDKLTQLLTDEDRHVRGLTAEAFAEHHQLLERAIDETEQLLIDHDRYVQQHAAEALGKQYQLSELATDELVQLLSDKDKYVRSQAARALTEQHQLPEPIIDKLGQLLTDENSWIRERAAEALGKQYQLLEPAVYKLIQVLLTDEDSHVREQAVQALNEQQQLSRCVLRDLLIHSTDQKHVQDVRQILRGRTELGFLLASGNVMDIQRLLTLWLYDSLDGFPTYVVLDEQHDVHVNLNGRAWSAKALSQKQLKALQEAQDNMRKEYELPSHRTSARNWILPAMLPDSDENLLKSPSA